MMSYSSLVFEVGEWQLYELVLLCVGLGILLLSLLIGHWWPLGLWRWTLVLIVSGSLVTLCVQSRYQVSQLSDLLVRGGKLEVVEGNFHYGDYQFSNVAKHGIDYREISLDERAIKLYHSGYLPSARCYRALYTHNQFHPDAHLRLSIYWSEYHYTYRSNRYTLKAPCIVKVEQLFDHEGLALAASR
ncbi:hypothetical protein K0I63_17475 [Shewanella rhizosphaerae]|uniref:hypothetical protein n=1 Tax=Shewanella rhizosphaerae TaxID=2864207 RepID=UPI001C659513|nr:hypothetical protein [Shewanella rhizosphaerae]QYK12504.1 hypothetical protein K0I63_17475 [Shewanella rhizosphaerae]